MAFLLFKNIIYNCKQATLLLIKKKEQRLTIAERVQLFVHLHYCDPCKRFVKQSDLIDKSLKPSDQSLFDPPVYTLSAETRIKIQQKLEENN